MGEMMSCSEKVQAYRLSIAAWVFAGLTFAAGCTPEKAAMLRQAALTFRGDAGEAVKAVGALMDAEIAPSERTDAVKTAEFVNNIMMLPKDMALNSDLLETAADPNAVRLSPAEQAARRETLEGLQRQYDAFSAMFDDLERGSFLAKDKVAQTKQYAVALTVQMANLGESFSEKPPRFVQKRATLIAKIDTVRKDASLSPDQERQQLTELTGAWNRLLADEMAMQADVVGKCSKAASDGQAVLQMIDGYGKLSVDDLGKLSESALTIGEQLSGRNLPAARARAEMVISYLNANPEYKTLVQSGLDKASARAAVKP